MMQEPVKSRLRLETCLVKGVRLICLGGYRPQYCNKSDSERSCSGCLWQGVCSFID
jgi:hypothetical protein